MLAGGCGGSGGSAADATAVSASEPVGSADFVPLAGPVADPNRGETGWAGDLASAWEPDITAEVAAGFPLLRSQIRLDAFRDRELTPDFLAALETGFSLVRKSGAKVIPRVAYNSPTLATGASLEPTALQADAPLQQVLGHIAQLGPVFERNRDVIASIEAGFIGAWGEWHSSANQLDEPAARRVVLDALLGAFPAQRPLLLRYPADVRERYPQPVTVNGRIGFHNDCFLSGDDDGGSWTGDPEGLRDYVRASTRSVPIGGETCGIAEPVTGCSAVLSEGARLRMSFLNRYGARPLYQDAWQRDGCLDEVRERLGHRFVLESASLAATEVAAGTTLALRLALRNTGWAPAYESRPLEVVLSGAALPTPVRVPVTGTDARDWAPGRDRAEAGLTEEIRLDLTIALPRDLPPGLVEIGLALPDPAPTLATDPRYAIRFANADRPALLQRHDASTGAWLTGLVARVLPAAR